MKSSGFDVDVGDDGGDGDDNGNVDGDSGDGEDNGNVDDDDVYGLENWLPSSASSCTTSSMSLEV